ncbi:MAG: TetR/AcrR family transcriptional regulator [Thermoleophilaceae bacterium]
MITSPEKSAVGEHAAPTRERILDAAVELFGRRGYSATSVGEVEEAAGLVPRRGALYKHFASKRELLDAAVERRAGAARAGRELAESLIRGDIRAEARAYGRGSLRIVSADQALMRIVMREGDNFPELRDAFHERIVRSGHDSTVMWLRRAVERTGAPEPDLEGLAVLILGPIIDYCMLRTLLGTPPSGLSQERFLDVWTDSTIKLLEAHGLVADDPKESSA